MEIEGAERDQSVDAEVAVAGVLGAWVAIRRQPQQRRAADDLAQLVQRRNLVLMQVEHNELGQEGPVVPAGELGEAIAREVDLAQPPAREHTLAKLAEQVS